MSHATVSAKGWVVIPRDLRRKYGLKPGTAVEIVDYGGELAVVPVPRDPVAALFGMFAHRGGSLTEELLAERRREHERDERLASR
jgi:AbrB family looped-hinge helix DNA binding protein